MKYKLIRQKRKTISVKITNDGDVIVKSPPSCSMSFINGFLREKEKWINKTIVFINQDKNKNSDFYNLKKIYIFGKTYDIEYYDKYIKIGNEIIQNESTNTIEQSIKKYMKMLSKNYLLKMTDQLSKKLNINYNKLSLTKSKTKWGSCNSKKQIHLNFRLVMLPNNLIEYIICHELCHIKEMNHSKKFWNLLECLGYNKKAINKQLKEFNFLMKMF